MAQTCRTEHGDLGGVASSRQRVVSTGQVFIRTTHRDSPMCLSVLLACVAALAHPLDIGVQDDGVFLGHYGSRDSAFALSSRLHANRIRVMVQSPKVASGHGWNFREFDALLDVADAHGMKVQMVLIGPPHRPSVRKYALFVGSAARHFRGRVDRYSIWNEPNHKGWLEPVRSAPRMYRKLYEAGYRV